MARRPSPPKKQHWYLAEEGEAHGPIFQYVAEVERAQFDVFDRFVKLEALYDPNSPAAAGVMHLSEMPGQVIENVIASCIDTVDAQISASEVRPRVMTDDGDFTTQQTAKRLGWYCEGLGKLFDVAVECEKAFRSGAKKGTGVVKVYEDAFGTPRVEYVPIDEIVVDDAECRNGGTPRQIHRRMPNVDRGALKAMFPDHEEAIDDAQTGRAWSTRQWAGYRPLVDDDLVVIESHKLPIGVQGKPGYVPGRHTITVDGATLLDEPYHKTHLPYAVFTWVPRENSFYGISLIEGLAGSQRALNKRNLQIDRQLDQHAFPTTYVSMADAHLAVQTINRAGTIVPIKGERPKTELPQAVGGEVYAHRAELKSGMYESSGVSRTTANAMKPAGIDSGVGLREYRDQTTQRFAKQEKGFERLVLQVYWLLIDVCKDLGEDAPVIMKRARFGTKRVEWKHVDMGDVRVQLAAASTLSRTPSGRYQTALEWAQAGVITTDEWRKLTEHPDLDRILSLYTQGMESVEEDIEAILDGEYVTPEPFGNLALSARMGQMAYLKHRNLKNCPEEVLEGLRQYTVQALAMVAMGQPVNDEMVGGQIPGAPPGGMPPPPTVEQPVSALAPAALAG